MIGRRVFLFPIFFFSVFISNAQTTGISGTIKDATSKESLPGVVILLDDTTGTNGITTDSNGHFEMKILPGNHFLFVRYLGYENQQIDFAAGVNESVTKNILLQTASKELGTIVVSASRFEQKLEEVVVSMEVLKPDLIKNINTTNIENAIDQVPGVTVIDDQANIRGGSGYSYGAGSRVLVLVDDIPMLTADAGDVKWSFLPVENLEQVEIIKGASSALFGSSAMNGIINFRTAYPKSVPETKVDLYSGFYDVPKRSELKWWGKTTPLTSGFNFYHGEKNGDLDWIIGSHFFKDDGYRQGETEQRFRINTNTRYRLHNELEGFTIGANANYMYTQGGLFFIWADDSSGAYIPGAAVSNYVTKRFSVDPFLNWIGNNGFNVKIKTRYFETINENDTKQESTAGLTYGEAQVQKLSAKINLTVTAGATAIVSSVVSDLYGNRSSLNKSIYIQMDKKFFDRLNLSFGARKEWYKIFYRKTESKPVFRSGVNYRILKATYVRTSYGQGYRYPTIAEKFIRTSVGPIVIYPNDSLESETGWSAEFGIKQGFKFQGFNGYLDVALFQSEYKNMMEFEFNRWGNFLVDPFFGLGFKSKNIGNTRIKGIDVTVTGEGSFFNLPLRLMAGYTYADPVQTDFDAKRDTSKNSANYNILKYRSRHTFKGDMEVQVKKFSLGISSRFTSFMENIDEVFNTFIPGVRDYRYEHDYGDWVFDGRIAYSPDEKFRISFITKNIFNHEYMGRPADMQPPRSFVLQFSLNY